MSPSDYDFIQQCLARDSQAWDEFVAKYSRLIYDAVARTLERFGHSPRPDILADLHNDVFVFILEDDCRLLRKFEGRNGCQLGHYLRVVSIRRTVDFLRRLRPTLSLTEEDTLQIVDAELSRACASANEGPAFLLADESHETLQKILGLLHRHERELCQMIFMDQLSPADISRRIGISTDNFYVRKNRLVDKLRMLSALEDQGVTNQGAANEG